MRPKSSDVSYLWDMLDAGLAITEFVKNRQYTDYLTDRMLRGAVERHIEIIGKAVKKYPEIFRLYTLRFRGPKSFHKGMFLFMNMERLGMKESGR